MRQYLVASIVLLVSHQENDASSEIYAFAMCTSGRYYYYQWADIPGRHLPLPRKFSIIGERYPLLYLLRTSIVWNWLIKYRTTRFPLIASHSHIVFVQVLFTLHDSCSTKSMPTAIVVTTVVVGIVVVVVATTTTRQHNREMKILSHHNSVAWNKSRRVNK